MEYIGQTKSILIPVKTEVWGSFTVVQKTNQNKPTALCEEDPQYSYTECMKDYVAAAAGCHLDDLVATRQTDADRSNGDHNRPPCVTREQVQKYATTLTNVSKLSWMELVKVTGCLAKCSYRQFSFEMVGVFLNLLCRIKIKL